MVKYPKQNVSRIIPIKIQVGLFCRLNLYRTRYFQVPDFILLNVLSCQAVCRVSYQREMAFHTTLKARKRAQYATRTKVLLQGKHFPEKSIEGSLAKSSCQQEKEASFLKKNFKYEHVFRHQHKQVFHSNESLTCFYSCYFMN